MIESDMDRWNRYFYRIASAVAGNSQCLSRQIGAVLVRNKSIISTGYNGPARGIPRCDSRTITRNGSIIYTPHYDGECPRRVLGALSGQMLDICVAAHAEVNCIANAARNGVNTFGSTMYMTCEIPCKDCMAVIINAGVSNLVVADIKFYDDQAKYEVDKSHMSVRDFYGNTYLRWKGLKV